MVKLARGDDGRGVVVYLEDGTVNNMALLTHKPRTRVNGPFVSQLGLELTEQGVYQDNAAILRDERQGRVCGWGLRFADASCG